MGSEGEEGMPPAKQQKVSEDSAPGGADPGSGSGSQGDPKAPTRRSSRRRATGKAGEGKAAEGEGEAGSDSKPGAKPKTKGGVQVKRSVSYEGVPMTKYDLQPGTFVGVKIRQKHLSSNNKQVRRRQLWGTNVYTMDSDLLAVLVHMGYVNPLLLDTLAQAVTELYVVIKVLPGQDTYPSRNVNNMRSRAWHTKANAGISFTVESCRAELAHARDESGEVAAEGEAGSVEMQPSMESFAIAAPTFVPAETERVVNTRSSSNSTDRKQRFVQEITLQYNLCNEPWMKYAMSSVADAGLSPSQWTSAKLRREALFAESQHCRYQLSLEAAASEAGEEGPEADVYSWARCKEAYPVSEMRKLGIPLPDEQVEVLQSGLLWQEFLWAGNGVHIKGKFFPLARIHFMATQEPAQ